MSGNVDEAKGKVKKATGELTDDQSLKNEGDVDKASGKVKQAVDSVKDALKGDK
jgi:uncharacterized protein YjbJ (UPF0337 family)